MKTQVAPAYDTKGELDKAVLSKAGELLRSGKLVIIPTETVYGIGANALDPMAVSKIFKAKDRPQDNPLIVHIADPDDIIPLTAAFPREAKSLADAFWPGPLTIILPKSEIVPDVTSGGLGTVAVRIPAHPVARAVISLAGVPIAAPSANISGRPSPTTAQHCVVDMSGRVPMIVDGGSCEVGVESTVITLAENPPRILRPGAVTAEMLRSVLGNIQVDDAVLHKLEEGKSAPSPGMKYRHYAPKADMELVHGSSSEFACLIEDKADDNTWILAFNEDLELLPEKLRSRTILYGHRESPKTQARRLFAAIRELDEAGATKAFVHAPYIKGIAPFVDGAAPSTEGDSLAVYNRLLRACGFKEIYL